MTLRTRHVPPVRVAAAALAGVVAAGLVGVLAACGGGADRTAQGPAPAADAPGPVHVHGLGVDPADGALYLAAHTGLFRFVHGRGTPTRVADRYQDTMGFAVVGRRTFLGSGHPDLRDDLPPLLGLIRSADAGRTWKPVSLLGEADFHTLSARGTRVYGYDVSSGRLLRSDDRGRTWQRLKAPEPVADIAVGDRSGSDVVAAGATAVYRSRNGGRTWMQVSRGSSLVEWPARDTLFRIGATGVVHVSRDSGATWEQAGSVRGRVAAFLAADRKRLYVALHSGAILESGNGGSTWGRLLPASTG